MFQQDFKNLHTRMHNSGTENLTRNTHINISDGQNQNTNDLTNQAQNLDKLQPGIFLNPLAATQFGDNIKDEESLDDQLINELNKSLITIGTEVPKPDTILYLTKNNTEYTLFTRGSLSLIIGKAKGGKTSLISLLVASVLQAYKNNEVCISSNAIGNILFFDTEQGRYYSSLTLHKIAMLAGNSAQERLKYYDLREYSPDRRLMLIEKAIQLEATPSIVVIDGIRDVAFDINSPAEAVTIATKLMALSSNYNTHILSILHQNKGDANARGHLGTEMVNKAEIVISVNKDNNEGLIKITPEYSRGLPFPDLYAERDESGVLQIVNESLVKSTKGESKFDFLSYPNESLIKIVQDLFKNEDHYIYGKIWPKIQYLFELTGSKIGDNNSKKLLMHLVEKKFIIMSKPDKGYTIYKSGLQKEVV